MSVPSSSSNASSPSFNNPDSGDDVAAACFNPLFINTSAALHSNHNLNNVYAQSHSSISGISHNYMSNTRNSITGVNHSISNNSQNQHSITSFHKYHSTNYNINHHSHKGIIDKNMAGNSSPSSMQLSEASPSRKVHVVYYLSRSGQLEHPHLLEVSIPPNQGLYLRDVKKRLAAIRGKRLPLTFAWSYKRSYKNGYVWQDLCDDDLIFPAHGCEYVLKGSEMLSEQNEDCGHSPSGTPSHNPEAGLTTQNGAKEEHEPTSTIPKGAYQNHEEAAVLAPGAASLRVSLVEIGTDVATQTEEELRQSNVDTHEFKENSTSLYINHYKLNAKHPLTSSPQKASCTSTRPQHATELNRTDIASPPSSSSTTNSPSPYKELASTSSSSASGFNMAMEHNDNVASNEQVKANEYNLGSKTPGRTWVKHAIHKLDEQDELVSLHAEDEEGGLNDGGVTNPAHENTSSKNKYRSMGSNSIGAVIMEEGERSPAGSAKLGRSKHSGALSLLQFMSCGGLDIKEQILPMSLYRLRSKGTPAAANQLHMSNYFVFPEHSGAEALGYSSSESGKIWTKIGKPKSLYNLNGSKLLYKASDEFNVGSEVDNQWVQRKHHYSQHEGASAVQATSPSPTANGSSAKALGRSIPDVISIGRSSLSDRSTNVSHELEYQVADAHAKLKKSGEVMSAHNIGAKSSPQFYMGSESSLDLRNNEGTRSAASTVVAARAVSGEILMNKGSPLFVPSKRHLSYSGTPLNYASNGKPPLAQLSTSVFHAHEGGNTQTLAKQDTQNKACSSSCNPSRAFSEGEVSSLLANRIVTSNPKSLTINGYDQSMAQLWEELLAAPVATSSKSEEHQHKDGDYQRVRQATMGSSSWEVERTLQNAVELSLQPPLEHLPLLLDCPQCGRKLKAELFKAHVKNCSSPKANSRNSLINPNFNNNSNNNNNNTSSSNNSLGKSPKSDSNLCQRFLRASPPPTKL